MRLDVLDSFSFVGLASAMPNAAKLTPEELNRLSIADPDEIRKSISHALQFNGRQRNRHAANLAADIAADLLVKALETGNYVIMQRPAPYDATTHIPRVPLTD
jgi:hypothetical protein